METYIGRVARDARGVTVLASAPLGQPPPHSYLLESLLAVNGLCYIGNMSAIANHKFDQWWEECVLQSENGRSF